jgi:hypothetical protein
MEPLSVLYSRYSDLIKAWFMAAQDIQASERALSTCMLADHSTQDSK